MHGARFACQRPLKQLKARGDTPVFGGVKLNRVSVLDTLDAAAVPGRSSRNARSVNASGQLERVKTSGQLVRDTDRKLCTSVD